LDRWPLERAPINGTLLGFIGTASPDRIFIGGGMALLGVVFTNRASDRRLRRQLKNDRKIRKMNEKLRSDRKST